MRIPFYARMLALCAVMASPSALADAQQDMFYDANIVLRRAARLEKEGDYKGAVENSQKAEQMFNAVKRMGSGGNSSWVDDKIKEATEINRRVKPLVGQPKKNQVENHSLKPGEVRDYTVERAYKAHDEGKTAKKPYSPSEERRINAAHRAEQAERAAWEAQARQAEKANYQKPAPQPKPTRGAQTPKAEQRPTAAPARPQRSEPVARTQPKPVQKAEQRPAPQPVIRSTPTTNQRPYIRPQQTRPSGRSRFRIGG